ncbi:hypothetical protein K449DRAFT_433199 [Hypoxylon sp. EC38]|nr:hypothetical protein K449DRAFT_433199 [Hypoxylon sp. EC38]
MSQGWLRRKFCGIPQQLSPEPSILAGVSPTPTPSLALALGTTTTELNYKSGTTPDWNHEKHSLQAYEARAAHMSLRQGERQLVPSSSSLEMIDLPNHYIPLIAVKHTHGPSSTSKSHPPIPLLRLHSSPIRKHLRVDASPKSQTSSCQHGGRKFKYVAVKTVYCFKQKDASLRDSEDVTQLQVESQSLVDKIIGDASPPDAKSTSSPKNRGTSHPVALNTRCFGGEQCLEGLLVIEVTVFIALKWEVPMGGHADPCHVDLDP